MFSYENKYRYAAFLFYAGVITISVGACVYGVYVRSYFDEWGLSILYAWIIDFCGIDVLFLIFDVLFFHLWTRNKSPTLERWCDIEELFEYYTWKEHFHHHHGDN